VLHHLDVDKFFVPPRCEFLADSEVNLAAKTCETGIPIAPDFAKHKDKQTARRRFGLDPKRMTILLSFGGLGLTAEQYLDIFNVFFQREWTCQFIVLTGKNTRYRSCLEKKYGSTSMAQWLRILDFDEHVADCYAAADLFIGKAGGLSTSEALAAGIPIIVLGALPGQEEINARVLVDIGVAVQPKSLLEVERVAKEVLFSRGYRNSLLNQNLGRPRSSEAIAATVFASLA
jgi:processive 1,2-diacylglycerol beta-glucosyltransferase